MFRCATVERLSVWNKSLITNLTSCNEAQWYPGDIRWCCRCPKCAFSYSLIEACTDRNFAIEVVGKDLLIQEELEETWRRLFDPNTEKPFECVGEKRETLMALLKCKQQRLQKKEPLGILVNIPDIEFDPSLIKISPPNNIPTFDLDRLNSAI